MNFTKKQILVSNVTCRVLIAFVGGYILSSLSAILIAQLLPGDKINSIIAGLMLSFIIYTVTVIVVFAMKTTLRAGAIVFSLGTLMYFLYHYLNGIAV